MFIQKGIQSNTENIIKFYAEGVSVPFSLSSDIRSEESIAIVKLFDLDFLVIFHSTALPQSKNVF